MKRLASAQDPRICATLKPRYSCPPPIACAPRPFHHLHSPHMCHPNFLPRCRRRAQSHLPPSATTPHSLQHRFPSLHRLRSRMSSSTYSSCRSAVAVQDMWPSCTAKRVQRNCILSFELVNDRSTIVVDVTCKGLTRRTSRSSNAVIVLLPD